MLYTLLFWRECLNPEEIEKWKTAGKLARDALHFGRDLIEGWDRGFHLGYSQFKMNKQRTDIKATNPSDNNTKIEILYKVLTKKMLFMLTKTGMKNN